MCRLIPCSTGPPSSVLSNITTLDLSLDTKAYPKVHRHVSQHPESPHDTQIHSTVPRNTISLMHRQKYTACRLASKVLSWATVHRRALQQRRALQHTLTLPRKHLAYREDRSNRAPRPVLLDKDTSYNVHPQPITQTF